MKKQTISFIKLLLLSLVLILLDQGSKYLAVRHLKAQPSFVLIKGVFQLTYAENIGAAFSILENQQWFFILTAILISGALLFGLWRLAKTPDAESKSAFIWGRVLGCMILAGALGNVIDRLSNGYVVDMFDFVLIHFPIFNVADSYITVAVAAVLVILLFFPQLYKKLEEGITHA